VIDIVVFWFGMGLAVYISKFKEREVVEMAETWKYHGRMDNGEAVFVAEGGRIAVEKDQRYLVDARPEELFEILRDWPELVDQIMEKKSACPIENEVDTAELKNKIAALEDEAAERREVVAALEYANDERDTMIESLMGDIAELKGRLLGAHETNRRWKEEVERRDGTIEALMSQIKEGGELEDGE